jgi:hypothetical protein
MKDSEQPAGVIPQRQQRLFSASYSSKKQGQNWSAAFDDRCLRPLASPVR